MKVTSDELILTLVSLVRATHPAMLRQEDEGFAVDFESLAQKEVLGPDERLLLKVRAALEQMGEGTEGQLKLEPAESRRLAGTLAGLEKLQSWPDDVLYMSRQLRARLLEIARPAES